MKLPDFRKTIRIRIQTEKVCPKKPNLKKTQRISGRKQRIMKNLIVLKKPVFAAGAPGTDAEAPFPPSAPYVFGDSVECAGFDAGDRAELLIQRQRGEPVCLTIGI